MKSFICRVLVLSSLFFTGILGAQEVTKVNKNSFVMNVGELNLSVGKEYTFITSDDQLVNAKVTQLKSGKALLKTDDLSMIKVGTKLDLEETSASEEQADEETPSTDKSDTANNTKHQFTLGLGFASLDSVTLKNASGGAASILDKTTLFGLNIGYQYFLVEYFSLGVLGRFYGGDRKITDPSDNSSAEVDSSLTALNLFVAGHYNNFFLKLGFTPVYTFTLTENEDSVELDGSGSEIAFGYLHKFNNKHGLTVEVFKMMGEFEEVTLKDGDTTVLSGDLIHKVDQDATGIAVNWAFSF
jgi:hypothetical protein